MKMQNAEMEFVAFDAQDVIATSGDFFWFNVTGTGNWSGFAEEHGAFIYDKPGKTILNLDLHDSNYGKVPAALNQYYKVEWDSRNNYDSNPFEQYVNLYSVETIGNAGDANMELGSYQAIIDWITTNKVQ